MLPKLIITLREGYGFRAFLSDLSAGVTVGIVAIPLAMAFAIASGTTPDKGLFTAVIAGFLISALGGSRVQIGGPTGAFVVIIYSIIERHGYDGLALATMMAGVIVMLMGVFRLGGAIKFIPYPVVTGFTAGIALIIFSSQVKDFFGLPIEKLPAEFIGQWKLYLQHSADIDIYATLVAGISLLGMLVMRRFSPRAPSALLLVILSAALVHFLHLPVETIGSRFGGIPSTLPSPSMPVLDMTKMLALLPDAITIALLCAIESLLSAVVADSMTGYRHRSNTELVGQGIANIASVCFGGLPATGALARTATNIRSGAKTPVAGMVHALTVLLCLLLLAPWASLIPLATLAAILVIVAWNMAGIDQILHLSRAPRSDVGVLIVTFLLTVLVDLTTGVLVGIALATLLFIRAMSGVTVVEKDEDAVEDALLENKSIPEGVEVYSLSGPFFFGAADRLRYVLKRLKLKPKLFILRLADVPVIDATGLQALEQFALEAKQDGTDVILCEMNRQVHDALLNLKPHPGFGGFKMCTTLDRAIERARGVLSGQELPL